MDKEERRQRKAELRAKFRELSFKEKLEYFWDYYKWVIVCVIAAIFLTVGIVDWVHNLQMNTVLSVAFANNGLMDTENVEKEIASDLGLTDPQDQVEVATGMNANAEGEFDYYSQMAYIARLNGGTMDMLVMPQVLADRLKGEPEILPLTDLFSEEEMEKYSSVIEDNYLVLPDASVIAPSAELLYEPVYVTVMVVDKHMEETKDWMLILAERALAGQGSANNEEPVD